MTQQCRKWKQKMPSRAVPKYNPIHSIGGCVSLLFGSPLHGCRCRPHHFLLHCNDDEWSEKEELGSCQEPTLYFSVFQLSRPDCFLLSQGPLATLLPRRMTLWQHNCNPESPPNCNLRDANGIEKLIKIRRSERQMH